jgi:hypothetical protein
MAPKYMKSRIHSDGEKEENMQGTGTIKLEN